VRVRLDHGRGGLEFEAPANADFEIVETPGAPALADPARDVAEALAAPVDVAPLAELARGRKSAVVVISDKTRPVPNGLLLPPVLETLEAAGIPRERIEILVATGLHRANTREELVEMTSGTIVGTWPIRCHDARNRDAHRHLGRTERGTDVWIDSGYLDAELKVVTGLVEPHLMAGYSGGRKGVVPGLAAVETMRSLHGPQILEDEIGPGRIDGNPFHEELVGIARRAGCDFLLNVTIDRERRLTGVFAGDLERAFLDAARVVESHVRVDVQRPADVVVTSAGGYPLDATFYQAIKGLVGALNVVRRGGVVILAAEISEGLGGTEFRHLVGELESPSRFMESITVGGRFSIDQWMLQHLCQVLRKASVVVVSRRLDPAELGHLPIEIAPTVESALGAAIARRSGRQRVVVLPEGPYVLATVRGRKLSLGRAWLDDAA
jgi:lactate racemase